MTRSQLALDHEMDRELALEQLRRRRAPRLYQLLDDLDQVLFGTTALRARASREQLELNSIVLHQAAQRGQEITPEAELHFRSLLA